MTARTAVFLTTYFVSPALEEAYRRLCNETPENHDVYLVVNLSPGDPPVESTIPPDRLITLTLQDLRSLPYPLKAQAPDWRFHPGNEDLIFWATWSRLPDYDFYWGVEYDVWFEGSWRLLFDRFLSSDADLLGTTLYRARLTPNAFNIWSLRYPADVDLADQNRIKGFYPIYRFSRRGAQLVDAGYRAGWGGHMEIAWATILAHEGAVIEDIGGDQEFVRPENRNRFYFNTFWTYSLSPGTFVFRPNFPRSLGRPGTIWHPVKPAAGRNWHVLAFDHTLRKKVASLVKALYFRLAIHAWFVLRWRGSPGRDPQRQ